MVTAGLLAGCSSFAWFGGNKVEAPEDNDPPDVTYGKAEALSDKGKYADAAHVRAGRHQSSLFAGSAPRHSHGGLCLLQGRQV